MAGVTLTIGEDEGGTVGFALARAVSDEAELLAWCKGKLATFKLPKAAVVVAEIPRNPSGKILKRNLRALYESAG